MAQIFKNNTTGTLAAQLNAGATACTLYTGHTFTDPGSDWYLATLVGVTGTTETSWEIVKVTNVATNTLTIERAQESTSVATWPVGTRIEARLTAGATESKANLGAAAYKAVGTGSGDVAAGNRGVTNGDSHDHNGGDGAQIAYSSLSGLPTLGTAAATDADDYVPSHTAWAITPPAWHLNPNRQVGTKWPKMSNWLQRLASRATYDDTLTTPTGTYPGGNAFRGGVLLPDGRVFCVPASSTSARIYDPVADTLTTPTGTYPGSSAFYGGVLLPDGRAFCVPAYSTSARIYGANCNMVPIDINFVTSPFFNGKL